MAEKLVNFFMDEEKKKELDIIVARDGTTIKKLINQQLEDYIKKHQDGNDQHVIDNFLENEDFVGFPSMGIDMEKKKEYAQKYLSNNPDLTQELWFHVQEWDGVLKSL